MPDYTVKIADTDAERLDVQKLRYQVFVQELGASGPSVDHVAKIEHDAYDAHVDHLILLDRSAQDQIVGAYRLLRSDVAKRLGRFYTEDEYDLSQLLATNRPLLEMGRSCLHADHRGGLGMMYLWNAMAKYTKDHHIEILFGVASFHGTDPQKHAKALSYLHHKFRAPQDIRPHVKSDAYTSINLIEAKALDQKQAILTMPALIKGYLRLGALVGDGAYIDHNFNTTDVCLVLDEARMTKKQRDIYTKGLAA